MKQIFKRTEILIDFEDISYNTIISKQKVVSWIKKVLKELKQKGVSLSLFFCSNDTIMNLNQQYRGIDKPTDVLSFDQLESSNNEFEFAVKNGFLGDIIISVDKALEQSNERKISLQDEIFFLSLHGTLHLLGYDHDEENSGEMAIMENGIYKKLTGVEIE